jgi:DNA-binding response OmpR family regulator
MSKILVVEDEPGIAIGLRDDLAIEGYAVEIASDGDAACRLARQSSFDLILLDLMLPRKDGFTVCRELRRLGNRTPIIILTAKAQEAEKVLGLELGADDYVTKPFSPLELRARIKAVLRRVPGETHESFSFGGIEVDLASCQAFRNGQAVDLTATEFKLLSIFIRNRGRVLSRDKLLDEVWGKDTVITDRVVDNHVMNLRKKIEPNPEEPRYLTNIRGLGFRFDG